jgi:diguanylate cyclase
MRGVERRATLPRRVALIVAVSVAGSAAFCYTLYAILGLAIISSGVGGVIAFWAPLVTPLVVTPVVMVPLERSRRRSVDLLAQVESARAQLATEVAERQRAQERLEYEVRHDPLTGALNRRGFFEVCQSRPAVPMTICTVDVDEFKAVNDTMGHMAGDAVLCALADTLRSCVGERGWVARLGGDEFVVLHLDESAGHAVGTRLAGWRVSLGGGQSCWVSASVGSSRLDVGASVDRALSAADHEMFLDKRAKRVRTADRSELPARLLRLDEAETT